VANTATKGFSLSIGARAAITAHFLFRLKRQKLFITAFVVTKKLHFHLKKVLLPPLITHK
jgi:hypothetical protein